MRYDIKNLTKEQKMKCNYLSSMFGPILIGAGLLVSGALIAGLAYADMFQKPTNGP